MAKLTTEKRKQMKAEDFGIPSKRMYPLWNTGGEESDRKHVMSAVRLFGHASDEDKHELALNILKRAKELNIDSSGWDRINAWANKDTDKPKQEAYVPLSEFDHYFQEGMFGKKVSEELVNKFTKYINDINEMSNNILTTFKNLFRKTPTILEKLSKIKYKDIKMHTAIDFGKYINSYATNVLQSKVLSEKERNRFDFYYTMFVSSSVGIITAIATVKFDPNFIDNKIDMCVNAIAQVNEAYSNIEKLSKKIDKIVVKNDEK